MSPALFTDVSVFVLALLVGVEVIGRVPVTLHTPLMSGGNAIHGVVMVGVMLVAAATDTTAGYAVAFVAAVLAAINVVGGYVVTDRMLGMFRRPPSAEQAGVEQPDSAGPARP